MSKDLSGLSGSKPQIPGNFNSVFSAFSDFSAFSEFSECFLISSDFRIPFEVAAPSQSEALLWADKIRDTSRSASFREESNRKKERALRIARELSNLVIYCRSVVFNLERNMKRETRNHTEMSSFPETKAEKLMLSSGEHLAMFLWYHDVQLSRVYPKAQR